MWGCCCIQSSPVWSIIILQEYPNMMTFSLSMSCVEAASMRWVTWGNRSIPHLNKPKWVSYHSSRNGLGKFFFIGKPYCTLEVARWWHWERDPFGIVGAGLEARFQLLFEGLWIWMRKWFRLRRGWNEVRSWYGVPVRLWLRRVGNYEWKVDLFGG